MIPACSDAVTADDTWQWGTAVADRVLRLFLRHWCNVDRDEETTPVLREISDLLLQVAVRSARDSPTRWAGL